MFLSSVFVALLLHVTWVASKGCPTLSQVGRCWCSSERSGLRVICNGNLEYNSTFSVSEDDMATISKYLHLNYDAVECVRSHQLKKCLYLTRLNLFNHRIEVLPAEAFSGLLFLDVLSLNGNGIKFIDNSAFVGLGIHLSQLLLKDNELTAIPCLPLRNLTSLGHLDLENNKIADVLPEELDGLCGETLGQLNLAKNKIRHLPANVFKSMKRLTMLNLAHNSIESIHPSAFGGTLVHLKLDYNQLEEVPSAALQNMRGLSYIDLSDNKIYKIRKDDFLAYGRNLAHISLMNNSLKDLDENAFNGLDSLWSMWLAFNQLKTFLPATFAPVSDTLKDLVIFSNPIHCDCRLAWMKRQGSWIIRTPESMQCVTPKNYAKFTIPQALRILACDDV